MRACIKKKKISKRTCLVVQWLRICLSMQSIQVESLVQEDPTCCRAAKPICHNYRACALRPVLHTREATAMRSSRAQSFNHAQLFVTLWTVTHRAPLPMKFSRQEYWSGMLFPTPEKPMHHSRVAALWSGRESLHTGVKTQCSQ